MILVVEDDLNIRKLLYSVLVQAGYKVDLAKNGLEGVNAVSKKKYDLILMDLMMPEMDGHEAIREIRKFSDTSVIFVSALSDEKSQVEAYNGGADGYILKPFSIKILLSIIDRHLNKKKIEFKAGDLYVNFSNKEVLLHEKELKLTVKERELLFHLIKNRNILCTREGILNSVWGADYNGTDRVVDNNIKKLRNTLGKYGDFIKTVKMGGYIFENKI